MRAMTLVLLLLFPMTAWAQSQELQKPVPPITSKTKGAEKPKSDTETKKSDADKIPTSVNVNIGGKLEIHSEDRKESTDTESSKWTDPLSLFTLLLVGVTGGLFYVAWRQGEMTRTIERAYVTMTQLPPGLHFEEEGGWYWVHLRIQNFGKTPARVTARCINAQHVLPSETLPAIPDYSQGVIDTVGAFLMPNGHVGNTLRARFPAEDIESMVRAGQCRWLIFGYVDYIDQFGKRHRAGYGREYSVLLDNPHNYPAEDFPKRSNLVLVPEPNYNYDRQRRHGKGHDWTV